jgi:hypothetical protein
MSVKRESHNQKKKTKHNEEEEKVFAHFKAAWKREAKQAREIQGEIEMSPSALHKIQPNYGYYIVDFIAPSTIHPRPLVFTFASSWA